MAPLRRRPSAWQGAVAPAHRPHSLKATADTAYRKLYVSPGLGEAVCVHSEPSQCKARVWTWPALIT